MSVGFRLRPLALVVSVAALSACSAGTPVANGSAQLPVRQFASADAAQAAVIAGPELKLHGVSYKLASATVEAR